MASVSLDPADLVFLIVTATAAIVAARVLWSLASSKHRRSYGRPVKFVFLFGAVAGLIVPWDLTVGLLSALAASFVLLLLALTYPFLGRRSGWKVLALAWVPRETMRDWFLYLSVGAGVIGVVATVVSLLATPFLQLSLSSYVPLAFDTVSILSALLEFTVYIPSYNHIFALVYTFITQTRRVAPDSGEPYIDDLDFKRITEGSHYTDFEVRDAMEWLVRKGFASKISPVPVAKVVFKIGSYGVKYLRSVWEEVFFSMEREKAQIETRMLYLKEKLRFVPAVDRELAKRIRAELAEFRRSIDELGDYGALLGESKKTALTEMLSELEKSLEPVADVGKDGAEKLK
jgi:hypothetical protein